MRTTEDLLLYSELTDFAKWVTTQEGWEPSEVDDECAPYTELLCFRKRDGVPMHGYQKFIYAQIFHSAGGRGLQIRVRGKWRDAGPSKYLMVSGESEKLALQWVGETDPDRLKVYRSRRAQRERDRQVRRKARKKARIQAEIQAETGRQAERVLKEENRRIADQEFVVKHGLSAMIHNLRQKTEAAPRKA